MKATVAWTEAERQKLITLVEEGLSAAQIGQRLGRPRNSIIGKIHREGLKLMRKTHSNGGRPKKNVVAASHSRTAYGRSYRIGRAMLASKHADAPTQIRLPLGPPDCEVGFHDLRPIHCRSVIYVCHPSTGVPSYCGAPKLAGSSFCPYHHAQYYIRGR